MGDIRLTQAFQKLTWIVLCTLFKNWDRCMESFVAKYISKAEYKFSYEDNWLGFGFQFQKFCINK
jgi:hypothetical protein